MINSAAVVKIKLRDFVINVYCSILFPAMLRKLKEDLIATSPWCMALDWWRHCQHVIECSLFAEALWTVWEISLLQGCDSNVWIYIKLLRIISRARRWCKHSVNLNQFRYAFWTEYWKWTIGLCSIRTPLRNLELVCNALSEPQSMDVVEIKSLRNSMIRRQGKNTGEVYVFRDLLSTNVLLSSAAADLINIKAQFFKQLSVESRVNVVVVIMISDQHTVQIGSVIDWDRTVVRCLADALGASHSPSYLRDVEASKHGHGPVVFTRNCWSQLQTGSPQS